MGLEEIAPQLLKLKGNLQFYLLTGRMLSSRNLLVLVLHYVELLLYSSLIH